MGVTGLTSFLSRQGEKYKKVIHVSHQPVVIDGNNLMFHIYNLPEVKKFNHHLFGGDCALYAVAVRNYFLKLKCCKIHPIVIYDGAYEAGKLKTRMKRFSQSLKENVRQSQPGHSYTTTLMKDIMVDVLTELRVDHFQTEFEADDTVAYIAQQFSCPILSSDSDFFIYANVTTIPFGTINFKRRKSNTINDKNSKKHSEVKNNTSTHIMEGKCIVLRQMCEQEFNLTDPRLLPLTAVVIGNDQISTSVFANFMSKYSVDPTKKGKELRMAFLLKWFSKQRSYEGALETLLNSIKAIDRVIMKKRINEIVQNYMGWGGEEYVWNLVKSSQNLQTYLRENQLELPALSNPTSDSQHEANESEGNQDVEDELSEQLKDININEEAQRHGDETDSDEEDDDLNSAKVSKQQVPQWFLESLCKCKFPTPVCKILYNKTIYLLPQVEVTHLPSSHAISVPIIQVLAGVLYSDGIVTLVSRDKYNPVKLDVPTITSFSKDFALPSVVRSETEVQEDFRKTVSYDKRLAILLRTLLLKPEEESFLHEWPPSMKLLVLSCIYYLRKLKKTKDLYMGVSVVIAIILCCLKSCSFAQGNKDIKSELLENDNVKISVLLQNQPTDKCFEKMLIGFASSPESTSRKFWRSYDMNRVFLYSQFQSVIFHAQTLNVLLGEPLRAPKYSVLNCNLVYNLCTTVADVFNGSVNQFLDHYLDAKAPMKKVLHKFIQVALEGVQVHVPSPAQVNERKEEDRKLRKSVLQKKREGEEETEKLNRYLVLDPETVDI